MLRRPPRPAAAIAVALGALCGPSLAPAAAYAAPPGAEGGPAPQGDSVPQSQQASTPTPPPPKATRRSGFTFGIDVGAGVASIVGFPNDLTKIGYAQWYTATGARPAATLEAWAGGALSDWLTVGLGFKGSRLFATNGDTAESLGGMFHVEAYPLFLLGGPLRDLGVRFDAGLGTASVTDASGTKLVDGSAASIVGGGIFYEGIRAWKTAHGPFIMGDYAWTDAVRRPAIFIGWRSAIYTGP
jgi:hypothetical protein